MRENQKQANDRWRRTDVAGSPTRLLTAGRATVAAAWPAGGPRGRRKRRAAQSVNELPGPWSSLLCHPGRLGLRDGRLDPLHQRLARRQVKLDGDAGARTERRVHEVE